MSQYESTSIEQALQLARGTLQQGRPDLAEVHYKRALEQNADQGEALTYIGGREALRGRHVEALDLLERARRLSPSDPAVNEGAGIALLHAGNPEAARLALQAALAHSPERHIARLFLGHVLTALGQMRAAAVEYVRAVSTAQRRGLWQSADSTAPLLRNDVKLAIERTRQQRRSLIDDALAAVRDQHGRASLERVDRCIAAYLGETPSQPADARQKPKALWFPDLPTTPYFARDLFPWADAFERATTAIQAELHSVLTSEQKRFEPFLGDVSGAQTDRQLRNDRGTAAVWDAFFFYRHGKRHDDSHAACPVTSSLLEASPLAHIRDHAPEVCFSMLTPGTHILPHHGDTNTRVVMHLPLMVPPDCALVVGGVPHIWQPGEIVAFDDTFEHEAWNRGTDTRVVLIVDAWNPHLTLPERDALLAMVPILGDFDRECTASPTAPVQTQT
ncbi:MAG: aspartyl/asparaginyl beta-hydroxylase domain-containing protein [Pseudomonadota bacterium]|nr:aspartyl/asparaginyl beta-hydroxylase domain-containing protein [Pseudomonadota bacterium]